jgi:hypothetical protein
MEVSDQLQAPATLPLTLWIGGGVGLRAGLDVMENRKISLVPVWSWTLAIRPVARCYTDWNSPTPLLLSAHNAAYISLHELQYSSQQILVNSHFALKPVVHCFGGSLLRIFPRFVRPLSIQIDVRYYIVLTQPLWLKHPTSWAFSFVTSAHPCHLG